MKTQTQQVHLNGSLCEGSDRYIDLQSQTLCKRAYLSLTLYISNAKGLLFLLRSVLAIKKS